MDIDGLLAVAQDFRLTVIEDARQSLGSTHDNHHTGTFDLMATFSFNGNKTITAGGGGAILIDDPALARRAKHLTTTAKVAHRWEHRHNELGYNYRFPNINAAFGCGQLEQTPALLESKRRLFERYQASFASVPQTRLVVEPQRCHSNYWLQTLLLDESAASQRDAILRVTNDAGLVTQPTWTLMHRLPPDRDCPAMDLPVAESLERRLINLPSSAHYGALNVQARV